MLTPFDIEFMKNSVRSVIDEWNTKILILEPLPLNEQPNYNMLMHEYTGEIKYKEILMNAERKDIVQNTTNRLSVDDATYGMRNAGTMLYSIPNIIPVFDEDGHQTGIEQYRPNTESIFIIDDTTDRYYLKNMKDRLGETLIELVRYEGNTPKISDTINQPVDGLSD